MSALQACVDCGAKPSLGNQETLGDPKKGHRCNKCREAFFKEVFKRYDERQEKRRMDDAIAFRDFIRGGR